MSYVVEYYSCITLTIANIPFGAKGISPNPFEAEPQEVADEPHGVDVWFADDDVV